ncbi:hypothetical protein B0H16DRAFT_1500748 [Mycena metata]|uniref:Uncharacterized protein n=1 Tax=Mycena metata TaxID=1033252 RepID=A0AAD7K5U3_9AGAR|nr:hypothetical protein B0H16DRAFT_1500748 [Mycena metata]
MGTCSVLVSATFSASHQPPSQPHFSTSVSAPSTLFSPSSSVSPSAPLLALSTTTTMNAGGSLATGTKAGGGASSASASATGGGTLGSGGGSSNSFAHNVGGIVGVAIGGVVALIIGVVLLFFLCSPIRRRFKKAYPGSRLAGAAPQMRQLRSSGAWRSPLGDDDDESLQGVGYGSTAHGSASGEGRGSSDAHSPFETPVAGAGSFGQAGVALALGGLGAAGAAGDEPGSPIGGAASSQGHSSQGHGAAFGGVSSHGHSSQSHGAVAGVSSQGHSYEPGSTLAHTNSSSSNSRSQHSSPFSGGLSSNSHTFFSSPPISGDGEHQNRNKTSSSGHEHNISAATSPTTNLASGSSAFPFLSNISPSNPDSSKRRSSLEAPRPAYPTPPSSYDDNSIKGLLTRLRGGRGSSRASTQPPAFTPGSLQDPTSSRRADRPGSSLLNPLPGWGDAFAAASNFGIPSADGSSSSHHDSGMQAARGGMPGAYAWRPTAAQPLPSPAFSEDGSGYIAPTGLLRPGLAMLQPASSQSTHTLGDHVDYSRPFGARVNVRMESAQTFRSETSGSQEGQVEMGELG